MSVALPTVDSAPLIDIAPRLRVANVLGLVVFGALVPVFIITAIPYGTAEAWWKALFVDAAFTLGILWLIEGYLSRQWITNGKTVLAPVFALAAFSILQAIAIGSTSVSNINSAAPRTISVDAYETKFFAAQIAALGLYGLFLFRYLTTRRRLFIVINLVIAIAFVSAIFGIIRQTTQHSVGFGLPLLRVEQGYGQFINRNHFAFLMEMALGLVLGLVLGRGVKKEQMLLYIAAAFPIWTALAICGSRGGVIAMLAQLILAAFLLSGLIQPRHGRESSSPALKLLKSTPIRAVLFLVLVGGVVFGTLYLGGEQLATRIEQSRTELTTDRDELRLRVQRNQTWSMTIKIFAAHPLLGVGMGAYWAAVPQFHDASGVLTPQEAHNDYLELLASGGIVGLAIGVWFAISVVRKIKTNLASPHRLRRAVCLGATIGIAGVAVHSLVDFGLHMMINALVFTTLVVLATSEQPWHNERVHEIS